MEKRKKTMESKKKQGGGTQGKLKESKEAREIEGKQEKKKSKRTKESNEDVEWWHEYIKMNCISD